MTQQVNYGHIPTVTLGVRIQLALKDAQLTQEALESKFEVSRKTVSRWCNDKGNPPKRFILEQIAFMCGVSQRWLIDGVDEGSHPPDGSGMVSANVEIPRRARLLVVEGDGTINEEVTRQLAPVTGLDETVTLRLTAGCAANCATGDDSATLPQILQTAA